MNVSFTTMCAIVVVTALTTSVFIAPILWDAAGAIEEMLTLCPMGC